MNMEENRNLPTLSVVIPCYNTEQYLPDCLASVCAADMEDLEIICVIDGSPDNSAGVVRQWQERDHRIRMIEQENLGVSAARNTGMRAARGDFIHFLDSDDRLTDTSTLPLLCKRMSEEHLDILYGAGNVFFDPPGLEETVLPGEKAYFRIGHDYPGVYDGADLILELRRNRDWCVAVQVKIFRKAYLEAIGLVFPEGQIHEDDLFTFSALFLSKRVGVSSVPFVDRRVRPGSIMTQPLTHKNALGNLDNMIGILRVLESRRTVREPDHSLGFSVRFSKQEAARIYNALSEEEKALYMSALDSDRRFYHEVFVNDYAGLLKENSDLKKSRERLNRIENSLTYRIARLLSWPIRMLRRCLHMDAETGKQKD